MQTDDGRLVTVPVRRVVPRAGLDVKHGLQSFGSPPPQDRAFIHSCFGPPSPLSPPPPPSPPSPSQQPLAGLPPGWGPSRPPQPDEESGPSAEWLCHQKLSVPHLPRIEWLRKIPDSEHSPGGEPHPGRLPSIVSGCSVGESDLRGPLSSLHLGRSVRMSVDVQPVEDMAVRVRGLDVAVNPACTAGPAHVECAVMHRTRVRSVH